MAAPLRSLEAPHEVPASSIVRKSAKPAGFRLFYVQFGSSVPGSLSPVLEEELPLFERLDRLGCVRDAGLGVEGDPGGRWFEVRLRRGVETVADLYPRLQRVGVDIRWVRRVQVVRRGEGRALARQLALCAEGMKP